MRRYKIASQILLILSIFNFVLAVPVAVREIDEVRVNAVDAAKVGTAASEKRMDPGDQSSTNVGYLTDVSATEWNTISSDSAGSKFSELDDTATSRPTLPTGSPHPGSPDDSPPPPGPPAGNPPPSHSVPTDDPPPSQPGPAGDPPPSHSVSKDDPPPSQPGPAGNPPPSHPVSPTDDHSPPSAEPKQPGASEFEDFLDKLVKGRFKRRISGSGPGNVVEAVARYCWF
ncbi:hypothetical protein V8E52_005936 [Russula decolorans]|jgi:hypothetical protein